MKILLPLLMLGSSILSMPAGATSPAEATVAAGPDLSFCQEAKWAPECLKRLFQFRCESYAFPIPGGFAKDCTRAGFAMVAVMDLHIIDTPLPQSDGSTKVIGLKLIYKTKLDALISDPAAQLYLDDLSFALRGALVSRMPFDLYDFTLEHAQGDRALALKWLGVLLQDTSWTQVPVRYLEARAENGEISSEVWKATQNLKTILTILEPSNLRKAEYRNWSTIYPTKKLDLIFNPTIYHFYPIGYAAAELAETLDARAAKFAAFIPFLFNTDYEFQDLDPARWPLQHPAPFELSENNIYKLRDIYAGYTGAKFGVGTLETAVSFEDFQTNLSKDPFGEMRKQFFNSLR